MTETLRNLRNIAARSLINWAWAWASISNPWRDQFVDPPLLHSRLPNLQSSSKSSINNQLLAENIIRLVQTLSCTILHFTCTHLQASTADQPEPSSRQATLSLKPVLDPEVGCVGCG